MRGNPLPRRGFGVDEIAGYAASGVGKAPATHSEAKGAVQGGKSVVTCASETYRRRDYPIRRDKDEQREIGARSKARKRGKFEGERERERKGKRYIERERERGDALPVARYSVRACA